MHQCSEALFAIGSAEALRVAMPMVQEHSQTLLTLSNFYTASGRTDLFRRAIVQVSVLSFSFILYSFPIGSPRIRVGSEPLLRLRERHPQEFRPPHRM